ncbi:oxidoreductase [Lewinellaceae bacterium SD302]|nr:oxidoreductase [Lewinellaceae bacterium SD302]
MIFHWGILGLGKIARKFAEDLKTIEDAKLVAVGSRSQERATAFAADFGTEYAAGSYEALFNGPRVDAVYVATPHVSHLELVELCLENGVAVLCEKPLGLNYTQVEEMVGLAREKQVFLMEALWSRFTPTTAKVLELIEAGTIGEIEGLRADFGFRAGPGAAKRLFDPALGGGSLLDIGIYPIWLNQLLLGEPEEITVSARLDENGIDREIHVSLRNREGKLGHAFSTLYGRTKTEALIHGTKADLHWHTRFHEPSNFSILREDDSPENYFFERNANGYNYEAKAVMADVRAGRTENALWSLDDSLILHRTLTKIRELAGIRYPGE